MVQMNYLLGILTTSLLAANGSSAEIAVDSGKMSPLKDSDNMLHRRVSKAGKAKSDKGGSGSGPGPGPDPDGPTDLTGRFSGVDHASGAQVVVPDNMNGLPTDSKMTGMFEWHFHPGFDKMAYRVTLHNAGVRLPVNPIHLHCGRAGEKGPRVVVLCQPDPFGEALSGNFVCGDDDVMGKSIIEQDCNGVEIKNLASLYQAMREGLIYWNAHTYTFIDGEIRGQIFTL